MKSQIYSAFVFFCASCSNNVTPESISEEIEIKTNLKLNPNFEIIKAEHYDTPGAFDSDYTWTVELKYLESEEEAIRSQILNSDFFNLRTDSYFVTPIIATIDSLGLKGSWYRTDSGFEFLTAHTEENEREPFELIIDTTSNSLHYVLMHL